MYCGFSVIPYVGMNMLLITIYQITTTGIKQTLRQEYLTWSYVSAPLRIWTL